MNVYVNTNSILNFFQFAFFVLNVVLVIGLCSYRANIFLQMVATCIICYVLLMLASCEFHLPQFILSFVCFAFKCTKVLLMVVF